MKKERDRHLSLPLDFENVFSKGELPKCDLVTSIRNHLDVILTTYSGECYHDSTYGCMLWSEDFRLQGDHTTIRGGKDERDNTKRTNVLIRNELLESVKKFEKRLRNVRVSVRVNRGSTKIKDGVKRSLKVEISGVINANGKEFVHSRVLYFSPIMANK